MPPLSTMLKTQSLPGFVGVENPPTLPSLPPEEEGFMLNPYLRCPLPPFSTTVDTIRQWNMTGKTPVMRVIPLPTQQGAGGGATTVNNTTTTSSGGGTVTPAAPTTILPVTAFFNFPAMGPAGTFTIVLKMIQSFQLLQLISTQPIEVRMYSNTATQTQDIARPTDFAVTFDAIEGFITDVTFDTPPFSYEWQNRVGANADTPQTVNAYITVVNPSQIAGVNAGTVTVIYAPLES